MALVAVAVLFLYGFYEYHQVKGALYRTEELIKRAKVDKENLSTQLQGCLEQKLRLEVSLQKERDGIKKTKDEMSKSEATCLSEKTTLGEKFKLMEEEAKQLKMNYESLNSELEKHKNGDAVHEEQREQLEAENRRLKQQSANDIARLQDEVANLRRQNEALKKKLPEQQHNKATGDNANSWNLNNNRIGQVPQQQDSVGGARADHDLDIPMQINGPDDNEHKAYFKPKTAVPDHPVVKRDAVVAAADKSPVQGQVAPPDVDDDDNQAQNEPRRGVKHREDNQHIPAAAVVDSAGHDRSLVRRPGHGPNDIGVMPLQAGVRQGHVVGRFGEGEAANKPAGQQPLQVAEPHLQNDEENQLQGPRNDAHNAGEKDDEGDENEDYEYDDKNKNKEQDHDKVANDGPHAAPVEDDDLGKEERMR